MPIRIIRIAAAAAVLASPLAYSQSLKEKSGFGGNLTAVEANAIFAAEIKYCEATSPGFKSQAAPLLARMRAQAQYREIERNPDFARLAPEAYALVSERSKGADIGTTCRNLLGRLQ
jgi:hypothetical protein